MSLPPEEHEALVSLNATGLIGSVLYRRLRSAFGSAHEILRATPQALQRVQGIGKVTAAAIARVAREGTGARELEEAAAYDVAVLSEHDERYPLLLKSIYDHPLVLYVRGALEPEDRMAIGIVGTRKASEYGMRQAEKFGEWLARIQITVVSGMARGIDAAAHRGAMKPKGGRTIAVMGSGLRRIYPPEHKNLYMKITRRGAVVSEFPMQVGPDATHFPRRNRIISGLSNGTLVVEASVKSGALITADWALEQNREVFCVPGRIDSPISGGCHLLIKQGAKLVESVEDILMELPAFAPVLAKMARPQQVSTIERALLKQLGTSPMSEEQIIEKTRLPASAVTAALVSLKARAMIKSRSGGYVKVPDEKNT